MVYFFILVVVLLAFPIIIGIVNSSHVKSQRDKVDSLYLGMSEQQLLSIIGGGYNKSLLKNGRVKYEWRFSRASSVGTSYRGISTRTYSGVRKLIVYCKDGVVEEVKPYNV